MYAALIGLWLATAGAQEGPKVVTTPILAVRPRLHDGFSAGLHYGLQHETAVFTRARVGIEMERGTVSGRVVLQYVLDWLPIPEPTYPPSYVRTPPRLDLSEGWGRLQAKVPGGVTIDLKFGRMLYTLHHGRLISENDWLIASRPIDGLYFHLGLGNFHLQVVNFRDFSDEGALTEPGSTLVTVGSQRENPARGHTFDYIVLYESVDEGSRLTTGPYYTRQTGRFDMTLELYLQIATSQDLDATAPEGLASLALGWTFGPERLFRAGLRYDVYSLLDATFLDTDVAGWEAPLGDVYEYYGHMNLFQNPEDTDNLGLQDLAVLTTFNPRPRLQLELDLHYFWTALEARALGFEADGTIRVWFAPFASARFGYSLFLGGRGLPAITPIHAPYGSGYLEAEVKF